VPPQPPPLALFYLGKLIEADRTTVFLAGGSRNWAVRVGDTIDGAYRVEAIGDRTITLTYLALGTRQELEIGTAPGAAPQVGTSPLSEALPVAVSSRGVAPRAGETRLLLAAPSRVVTGNELIVNLALPPGSAVRDARVELTYDPRVLAPVGAPDGGGRVSVALAGTASPLGQVRFKVLAQSPTETQIAIERITATDARAAPVAIAVPGAYGIAIVARTGAN